MEKNQNTNPGISSCTAQSVLTFCLLSFIAFLSFCCFAMWAPFFPGEAEKRGVGGTEVGFIFGIYCLVSSFISLVYGSVVIPRIGPHYLLFAGIFISGAANVISGFGNVIQDHVLFTVFYLIMRAIAALGASACETCVVCILSQEFPEDIPLVIGSLEVFIGTGVAIGPTLGGYLYSIGGFRLPMLAPGTALLIMLPLVWLVLPRKEHIPPYQLQLKDSLVFFKQVITIPGVFLVCICCICFEMCLGLLPPTLELHAKTFEIGITGVPLIFLCCPGIYTLTAPITGYILNRKPWGRIFIATGFILLSISLLFSGPAPFLTSFVPTKTLWILIVSLLGMGYSSSLLFVTFLPEMHQCCRDRGMQESLQLTSTLSSFFMGFSNLGGFLGPLIGGTLNDYFGFPWTASIISFISGAQALVSVIFFICSRRRETLSHDASEKERLIEESAAGSKYSLQDSKN